jgi:hypothetical protein
MMDQTRIGYTYWNQPLRNAMPGVQEIQPTSEAEMGVAIEGSEGSWPGGGGRGPVLPTLDVYAQTPRYLEVFNRGLAPFAFTIEASEPWLRVEPASGSVERDQRVWVSVDWSAAPQGTASGSLAISGPQGAKVTVKVPIRNPEAPRTDELRGFVESDGYVSIEAEHFTRAAAPAGRSWLRVPGHGRTLSGMTTLPVTGPSLDPGPRGQWLEYAIHFFSKGVFTVEAHLAPTQKIQPGAGFRYAVSFDDETPQVVNVHADASLAAWEKTVADGVTVLRSKHLVAEPGPHVLKFWALDPALVLQKLVVDTGGLRPSYLGPPESVHRLAAPPPAGARTRR